MEKELIAWLGERYGNTRFARIGIGDDCAVLHPTPGETVLTCDTICEGVHFQASTMSPEQIGRKAIAVNLSDLAAMGAEARTILVSLSIPRRSSLECVKKLFQGMEPLAHKYGIEIVGGDTTIWDGDLVVSVTAVGLAPESGAWTMDGARPGDQILVTGEFGGSILNQHWAFEPRLDFANHWRGKQHSIQACTDASDSLGIDLANLAAASSVGIELDADTIPISSDAFELARSTGKTAMEHALTDGEDFQLILAVAPESAPSMIANDGGVALTQIGTFTIDEGFVLIQDGRKQNYRPSGYEHRLELESDG